MTHVLLLALLLTLGAGFAGDGVAHAGDSGGGGGGGSAGSGPGGDPGSGPGGADGDDPAIGAWLHRATTDFGARGARTILLDCPLGGRLVDVSEAEGHVRIVVECASR